MSDVKYSKRKNLRGQLLPDDSRKFRRKCNHIGKSMNKDVMDKLESVQKELKELGEKHNKLERRMDKEDADGCRTRILRFADELRRDVKHSEEFFNQILDDISDYERYCTEHPEYKNSKAVNAIAEIDKVYQKCMEKNSFL